MNIIVEFSGRQTGATTKALGTLISHKDNAFLITKYGYSELIRMLPEMKDRIFKASAERFRGKDLDGAILIFDDWSYFQDNEKKYFMNIVENSNIHSVYQFGGTKKLYKRKDFEKIQGIKQQIIDLTGSKIGFCNGFFTNSEDWNDLLLDWVTVPGAIIKTCSYHYANPEIPAKMLATLATGFENDEQLHALVRRQIGGFFLTEDI